MFKRVVFTPAESSFPVVEIPPFVTARDTAQTLIRLLAEIHRDHGLGYRETTYQGLLRAALQAERIHFNVHPTSAIGQWGTTAFRCIVVDNACAVSVTALGEGVSATDRATLQTCLRWLDLPWGIAAHIGRKSVDLRFAVRPKSLPQIQESHR